MSEDIERPEAQEEDVQVSTPEPAETEAAAEAAEEPAEEAMDPKEVEEGKVFAILSYALSFVGIPFFIVPLIMRNNNFALYHAKQCLIIWLLGLAGGVVCSILAVVCVGVILAVVLGIFCLVITVMGLINAINNSAKPVPLVGKLAVDWFKGLTKQ